MSTTFKFDELDPTTRDYLIAVRSGEGAGAPGVFVATNDTLPGCGLIAGPSVILLTLLGTLTTWLDVIYDDPIRVAMLQTGGLLVGGWLLTAGFRARPGPRDAGTWVYVDPLHLYEAYRETITVTPVDDVREAHFTHNYNNGNYQNSVVRISMGGKRVTTVTVPNEARAEQMVVFLNYVAWSRGDDGGARAALPAAQLGGLAKYVAKNDHEPLDADSNLNLKLAEVDIADVPEAPAREGHSPPAVAPYILMAVFAAVAFFVMAYAVNPPLRDEAIFEAVTRKTNPPTIEPRFLRAYLVDSRNTAHRDEVTDLLSAFYTEPIKYVRQNGTDRDLREGMAKLLDSVRTAPQPVVSLRVREENTPAEKQDARAGREADVRTQFVNKLNDELARPAWGQPIKPPPDVQFKEQPPPIGQQLLAFVEAPEDAKAAHLDISYTVEAAGTGRYRLAVRVDVHTNIDEPAVESGTFALPGTFPLANLGAQAAAMKDELVLRLLGPPPANPVLPPGFPPPFVPPGGGFGP
jgi:hypothetical protein